MLEDIKDILRVSGGELDTEIADLIASARMDLQLSGVKTSLANASTDPLIKRAIACYVKAHFGYDNPEADRFNQSYQAIKMQLTLTPEYGL